MRRGSCWGSARVMVGLRVTVSGRVRITVRIKFVVY